MTVHCRSCGQEWPQDPAKAVACPDCGADEGQRCVRPSGHRCAIHFDRDRLALARGIAPPCPDGTNPDWAPAAARGLNETYQQQYECAVPREHVTHPAPYRWPGHLAAPDSQFVAWRGELVEDTVATATRTPDDVPTVQEGTHPQVEAWPAAFVPSARGDDGWRLVKVFRDPPTLREAAHVALPTDVAGGQAFADLDAALESASAFVDDDGDADPAAAGEQERSAGVEETAEGGDNGAPTAADGGRDTVSEAGAGEGSQRGLDEWL